MMSSARNSQIRLCRRSRPQTLACPARCLGVWLVVLFAAVIASQSQGAEPDTGPFRIALSSRVFAEGEANKNNAKAAMKTFCQAAARERGIQMDVEAKTLDDITDVSKAVKTKRADAVLLTVDDYVELSKEVEFAPIFVIFSGKGAGEEYVLVVRRHSGIQSVGDLRARALTFYRHPQMCLARTWLDTLLMQKGFNPAEFCREINHRRKSSKPVLEVFFHKSDACVITRKIFADVVKCNSQIARQVEIIASSPEIVPVILCFRANYSPPFKNRFLDGLKQSQTSSEGQQALALFQSEKIEECPASRLQSVLDLLAEHDRLTQRYGTRGKQTALSQH